MHPTLDGWLYLSANTPHFWRALCEKTGLQALHADPRYDSVRKRAEHRDEIVPRLREALRAQTALEWEAIFGESVPCAAARSVADMFDDAQAVAEDMVVELPHPTLGAYRGFTRAWVYSRTPGPTPFAAPTLGQHTGEVRDEVAAGPA